MKKVFLLISVCVIAGNFLNSDQGSPAELKKLEFLVGNWKSISTNPDTGEESMGFSSVQWILGGRWLEWKFEARLKGGLLQVVTLIGYVKEKRKYAFYSFNSMEDHPLPHFGDWIESKLLRLEILENDGKMVIDFKIKGNGDFDQIHQKMNPEGKLLYRRKTLYTRTDTGSAQ